MSATKLTASASFKQPEMPPRLVVLTTMDRVTPSQPRRCNQHPAANTGACLKLVQVAAGPPVLGLVQVLVLVLVLELELELELVLVLELALELELVLMATAWHLEQPQQAVCDTAVPALLPLQMQATARHPAPTARHCHRSP